MSFFRRFAAVFALVIGVFFAINTIAAPVVQAAQAKVSQVADKAADKDEGPSPVIALILGILWPGVGHIYAGETGTGILIIILCVVSWIIASIIATLTFGIGGICCFLVWVIFAIWGGWGAYNAAKGNSGSASDVLKDVEKGAKGKGSSIDTRWMHPTSLNY